MVTIQHGIVMASNTRVAMSLEQRSSFLLYLVILFGNGGLVDNEPVKFVTNNKSGSSEVRRSSENEMCLVECPATSLGLSKVGYQSSQSARRGDRSEDGSRVTASMIPECSSYVHGHIGAQILPSRWTTQDLATYTRLRRFP